MNKRMKLFDPERELLMFNAGRKKHYVPHANMFCGYVDAVIIKGARGGKLFPTQTSFINEIKRDEHSVLVSLHGSRNFTFDMVRTIYSYSKYRIPVAPPVEKLKTWKGVLSFSRNRDQDIERFYKRRIPTYTLGEKVRHNNVVYECLLDHHPEYVWYQTHKNWKRVD